MPGLNREDAYSIHVLVPPPPIQAAIAQLLDAETGQIDDLLIIKEHILALLDEKRRAVVATAVTRGLEPDTKRRASGVPWLGDIPTHWEIERRTLALQ